jgi:hypothetical protein
MADPSTSALAQPDSRFANAWDAQKAMALATAGAVLAMLITATVNWQMQRDFARG